MFMVTIINVHFSGECYPEIAWGRGHTLEWWMIVPTSMSMYQTAFIHHLPEYWYTSGTPESPRAGPVNIERFSPSAAHFLSHSIPQRAPCAALLRSVSQRSSQTRRQLSRGSLRNPSITSPCIESASHTRRICSIED